MKRTTLLPIAATLALALIATSGCGWSSQRQDGADVLIRETEPVADLDGDPLSDWDLNGDAYLDSDEFGEGIGQFESYGQWDADGDGWIDYNEFDNGLFALLDTDDNGAVDPMEFHQGIDVWLGQQQEYFSDWDQDGNGLITQFEFDEEIDGNDYYNQWDVDDNGLLDRDEFAAALFDAWDRDDDMLLDSEEFIFT